jgi:hypothetical protein
MFTGTGQEVIHQQENGKWYWWDESWSVETGPFDTRELAQGDLNAYCKEFLDKNLEDPRPKCPTCRSQGFEVSILGPDRCTFCDGTVGGNPPTEKDIEEWKEIKERTISINLEGNKEEETPFDPIVSSAEEVTIGAPPVNPNRLLTESEVKEVLEKCFHHRIEVEAGKNVDKCHYIHNYCMIGNRAPLPQEKGMVADICIRGY